jgi:glycosyltransferase involved in cell wall biosynthesis
VAARSTIGIPFNYDENWIGGVYYIQNLVSSFNLLPSSEQPDVWVLSHSEHSFNFLREGSGYPRLHWLSPVKLTGVDGGIYPKIKWLGRLCPWFFKRKLHFDVIFPFPIDWRSRQTVCWIPDFQDKHLPELFTQDELAHREKQHRDYIANFGHIVFSSHAAESDFRHFYPEATTTTHVVHFAAFPPAQADIDADDLRSKYGVPERYFYCPNQFWIHKNHKTVLEAVALLADRGVMVNMVFSGKEHDHRAPDHAQKLRDYAVALGISDRVQFLGFLPRDEQMALFRSAIAIVQPSLFEGWSTVIEDAKAVSQYVIAADIPVNREQIQQNVEFFDPKDPGALAARLQSHAVKDPAREKVDYSQVQAAFAADFMRVVQQVKAHGPSRAPGS